MKIGIPKALSYYLNPILYDEFFKKLGVDIIYSYDTNKQIIEEGKKYSIDEDCLASKIYIGHVANLVDRKDKENIDYILIPRISYFNKRETVCVKFYAMYDICKNIFDSSFIDLNIDYTDGMSEYKSFVSLGKRLGFKHSTVVSSYIYAKRKQKERLIYEYNKQVEMFNNSFKDNKLKVLIIAHPYITYDKYLGQSIVKYLKNSGTNICFGDVNKYTLDCNIKFKKAKYPCFNISSSLYWKYNQNLVNGLCEYADKVDGVIYMSMFPCGVDALVNDLVRRKIKDKPSINIILDEQDMGAGLYTRLESFLDMLEQNKFNNHKEVG